MFTKGEIKLTTKNFNDIFAQDDLVYFTSKATNHKWIIQRSKLDPISIQIHYKNNGNLYYHKHGKPVKTVLHTVNKINAHDRHVLGNK